MARRGFPHFGKMRRAIRALQVQGEQVERVEIHGDRCAIVVAKRDTSPPADVVHEDAA